MLYGGGSVLVAAAYTIIGWQMVLLGTTLGVFSLATATAGEPAALLPLPLVVAAFAIALHALRRAAQAIRSVIG